MGDVLRFQMLLLDETQFAPRPPRDRAVRTPRAEANAAETLPLVFEAPPKVQPPPPSPIAQAEEARRRAVERSRARLLAKLEGKAAALPKQAPVEVPPAVEPPPADAGEAVVFLLGRKTIAATRQGLVKTFAERLGGDVRRSDAFDVRSGADLLSGVLDAKTLTVRFGSSTARRKWLGAVQRLAREHDLVEAE